MREGAGSVSSAGIARTPETLLAGNPTVTVTVPGTAGPWATVGTNSAYGYGVGVRTAPAIISAASGIPFGPGEYLQIRYLSGTVNAGQDMASVTQAAYGSFPVNGGPGANSTVFPSKSVPTSEYPANLICLIGTFADS